jgi:hypothetical protein
MKMVNESLKLTENPPVKKWAKMSGSYLRFALTKLITIMDE